MKITLLSFIFLAASTVHSGKSKQEKMAEEINFKSIKNILKNDFLEKAAAKKVKEFKKIKQKRVRKKQVQYHNPKEEHFWTFFSELWLVRNAQRLKWDFGKARLWPSQNDCEHV